MAQEALKELINKAYNLTKFDHLTITDFSIIGLKENNHLQLSLRLQLSNEVINHYKLIYSNTKPEFTDEFNQWIQSHGIKYTFYDIEARMKLISSKTSKEYERNFIVIIMQIEDPEQALLFKMRWL